MAATVLKVPKAKAVALFVAMGLKTAKNWSTTKLTEKINDIESELEEPLGDEELDALMDQLLDAEEAEVVDEEEEAEEEEAEEEEAEEEEAEEEERKPKAKAKGKGKEKKAKDKGKSPKKGQRGRDSSIDMVTMEMLRAKPLTLAALTARIVKQFPDHNPEALERTTKRRLTGHLQEKYGIKIVASDKGVYSIK